MAATPSGVSAAYGTRRAVGGAGWARSIVEAGPRRAALTLGLASASATLLAITFVTPDAAEPSTLYAMTETLLTLFVLGAAWLVRRRFMRTRRRSDLLLAMAVIVFGLVHLIACAVPAALSLPADGYLSDFDLCGQLLTYTLIAFAAFASHKSSLVGVRRTDAVLAAAGATLVGVAAGAAYVLKTELISTRVSEGSPTSHPLAIVLIGAAVGLLVAAGAGFARNARAGRRRDHWPFAWAAALMAAALLSQLNGAYAPGYDSAADALRLIGFGLVVGAGYRWELQVRRVAARAAAIAERQRVARDLHDGLAQDLAFIAAHGERMAAEVGAEHPVVTAARRALQISRCAIAELSDQDAANVHEALEATASELRARFGIAITLDVQLINELSARGAGGHQPHRSRGHRQRGAARGRAHASWSRCTKRTATSSSGSRTTAAASRRPAKDSIERGSACGASAVEPPGSAAR